MIPLAQIAIQKQNGFSKADEKQIEKEIVPQLESIDGVANVMFSENQLLNYLLY